MTCPSCDVTWNEFVIGSKCWSCGQEVSKAPGIPYGQQPQWVFVTRPSDEVRRREGERG